jgi:acyl-CoA thioesterase YciA
MSMSKDPAKEESGFCFGEPAIRTIAMPGDTNPSGDIFGGWLLSQMDLAAGNAAARYARGRCATIAIDSIKFLGPVKVGDEVTVWATLLRVGRTSMSFDVAACRRARDSDTSARVTRAVFTFVALDSDGRPRPVGPTAG